MNPQSTIAFFGSSLVSTYWNGAATYYRGILETLNKQGYRIVFYEPDILNRQQNRDIEEPDYAEVRVYSPDDLALSACLKEAMNSDIIIKGSSVGLFDYQIESYILTHKTSDQQVFFWDVDAPATLDRLTNDLADYFHAMIPTFDHILTYGGGQKVIDMYCKYGAKKVTPIYNAYSPATHFPVKADPAYGADLAFLGNRLLDRESRVNEFFFKVAMALPDQKFILGGSGWENKTMPDNVIYIGHVPSVAHNAFNCSSKVVLNISRECTAEYGFSPASRVFEATGAGACLITDAWYGVSFFFEPEREILVAANAEQVIDILKSLSSDQAKEIGRNALHRAINNHTYSHRAEELAEIFTANPLKKEV